MIDNLAAQEAKGLHSKPAPEGEISCALNQLSGALDRLHVRISELTEELQPICTERSTGEKKAAVQDIVDGHTPLGNDMLRVVLRINQLSEILDELNNRIDL